MPASALPPAVGPVAMRGSPAPHTPVGFQTPPTLLTSGDQRNPAVGHDRRCVAAGAVSDLLAVAEAGLAPGTHGVRRTSNCWCCATKWPCSVETKPTTSAGLGRRAVFALVIRRLPRTLRATAWSPPARSCAGTSCGARNSAHCPEPRMACLESVGSGCASLPSDGSGLCDGVRQCQAWLMICGGARRTPSTSGAAVSATQVPLTSRLSGRWRRQWIHGGLFMIRIRRVAAVRCGSLATRRARVS